MARSDSEQLDFYLALRDKIEDAINTGGGRRSLSFTIRGRTMQFDGTAIEYLEFVDRQIDKYSRLKTPGSARNKVRLTK